MTVKVSAITSRVVMLQNAIVMAYHEREAKSAARFPGERFDVTIWRRVKVARKSS